MFRVLWVLMRKPNSILLPWPRDCMNLVTELKSVNWSFGTGLGGAQWNWLMWSKNLANL